MPTGTPKRATADGRETLAAPAMFRRFGRDRAVHVPGGFPRLGLAPLSLDLRWDPRATSGRLRLRLERWERRCGNRGFEATRLERLPPRLAYELTAVYVALRERFPVVRPGRVDFASPSARRFEPLGCAEPYAQLFPILHRLACAAAQPSIVAILSDDELDPVDRSLARDEAAGLLGRRSCDLTTSGTIELSACFGHERCYRALLAHWARERRWAERRGRPPRIVPSHLSAASYVLVHEFGHLVDGCVLEQGERTACRVYGALSMAVFPDELSRTPRPTRWSRHVLNYPSSYPGAVSGPATGGQARRRVVRRALTPRIASRFGTYAAVGREELFAEAFALSLSARCEDLRRDLAPLRRALVDAGIARRRRSRTF